MAPYRFLTTWIFDAPIEEVWERLDDPMGWPRWWRGVESTETLGDDHWRVGTTAPWMNVLGPVARRAFAWNHGWIMRHGGEGLARDLRCSLVAAS